jgi:flagellar hook-length control protein FliK
MSVHLAEMGRSASRADMAAELAQRFESSAHQKGFQQTLLAEQQMLNGIEAAPLPPEDNHYAENHAASDLEQNDDVQDEVQDEEAQEEQRQDVQAKPKDAPKHRDGQNVAVMLNAKKGSGHKRGKVKTQNTAEEVQVEEVQVAGKKGLVAQDKTAGDKKQIVAAEKTAAAENIKEHSATNQNPKELSDKGLTAEHVVAAQSGLEAKVQSKNNKSSAKDQVRSIEKSGKVQVKSQTKASKKLEQHLDLKRTHAQQHQGEEVGEEMHARQGGAKDLSEASADTLTGHTTFDEKMTASLLQKDVAAFKSASPKQKQSGGIVQDISKMQSIGDLKGPAADKLAGVQRYVLRQVPLTQFGQALASKIASGARHLHIRLDPPELGKLDVDVKLKDGQVYLNVQTDSVNATEALEKHLQDLRAALKEQGLYLAGFDVSERQNKGEGQSHKESKTLRTDPDIITLKQRPLAKKQRDGLDVVA